MEPLDESTSEAARSRSPRGASAPALVPTPKTMPVPRP